MISDPGEREPLPHERRGAQGSQAGEPSAGQQAERRRSQVGGFRTRNRSSGRTASVVR